MLDSVNNYICDGNYWLVTESFLLAALCVIYEDNNYGNNYTELSFIYRLSNTLRMYTKCSRVPNKSIK